MTNGPKTVLVVEDFEDVVRRDERPGRVTGLPRAPTASDGREAVEKAVDIVPDPDPMDIAMPLVDGIEATRADKIRLVSLGISFVAVTLFSRQYHDEVLGPCGDRV